MNSFSPLPMAMMMNAVSHPVLMSAAVAMTSAVAYTLHRMWAPVNVSPLQERPSSAYVWQEGVIPNVLTPVQLGPTRLRNRIIRAATFEGYYQGPHPKPELVHLHREVAAGGVGMTTVAYCSVARDGLRFTDQMYATPSLLPDLRKVVNAVHEEGAAVSLQLGHGGYFCSPKVIGGRPKGASAKINLYDMTIGRAMTESELHEKVEAFISAAEMAVEAGFDAVEIHAGHGYLLSQFLSPFTNKRTDNYGGVLENRMRFPARVVRSVVDRVGDRVAVLVKMNGSDGVKGGLELDEAVQVAQMFEKAGAHGLIVSCGFTSTNPLFMIRGPVPVAELASREKAFHVRLGLALFGRLLVPHVPFEEGFLFDDARQVLHAVKIPVLLIGGVTSLDLMEKAMEEGFSAVQMARALIAEPDYVNKLIQREAQTSLCSHCNLCVGRMGDGVQCHGLMN